MPTDDADPPGPDEVLEPGSDASGAGAGSDGNGQDSGESDAPPEVDEVTEEDDMGWMMTVMRHICATIRHWLMKLLTDQIKSLTYRLCGNAQSVFLYDTYAFNHSAH